MKKFLLWLAGAAVLSACHLHPAPTATQAAMGAAVAPPLVVSNAPSFDGNVQNSGILDIDEKGAHVTTHFIERYDSLLVLYGNRLSPARLPGDREGISAEGDHFLMTGEAFNRFDYMNALRRADRNKPVPAATPGH